MEKRHSERLPYATQVMIGNQNIGLTKGLSRDISLGGMSVEAEHVRLSSQVPVTVRFQIETGHQVRHCEAHAVVVRQEQSLIFLMFDGMDLNTHQALRSLVGDWQIYPGESGDSQLALG